MADRFSSEIEKIENMFIYQFVYKTRFRTIFNEIKFSYNILKQER